MPGGGWRVVRRRGIHKLHLFVGTFGNGPIADTSCTVRNILKFYNFLAIIAIFPVNLGSTYTVVNIYKNKVDSPEKISNSKL